MAALPGGTLASGSDDGTVRLWDIGARTCFATLAGHSGCKPVNALAVLADGRLASGSGDNTIRLWDLGTRTCVGVLAGHTNSVSALAALPDGRLVSGAWDHNLRVWDTRPVAAAAGSHAVGAVPTIGFAHKLSAPFALVPLPGDLLASDDGVAVQLLHVPPPTPYE